MFGEGLAKMYFLYIHKWILLCATALCVFGVELPGAAQTRSDIQKNTLPQIGIIEAGKTNLSVPEQKMSSDLLVNQNQAQSGAALNGVPTFRAPSLPTDDEGRVIVDISATVTANLIQEIDSVGGKVIYRAADNTSVRAAVPLDKTREIAGRNDVRQVTTASRSFQNGYANQEGDVAHATDHTRLDFKISGSGVKVGVISDSLDDAYGSEAVAFNPGGALYGINVTIVDSDGNDYVSDSGTRNTGEGLAILEVIHTLAPAAELLFATGDSGGGPKRMADNIRKLAVAGCQIIVDDMTFSDEPPFQDGPISQAVDDVTAGGVLYFSSAGNSGNLLHHTSSTWEGMFKDGGPADAQFGAGPNARILDFGGGKTLNTIDQALSTDQDQVNFFWADPLQHSFNGYDLFLVNNRFPDKGSIVGQATSPPSTSPVRGTLDPYLFISNIKGRPTIQGASIVIVKEASAASVFLHVDVGRGILRYSTNGATRGHNANGASGAFSVAATSAPGQLVPFAGGIAQAVESFSADGPRWIFFDRSGTPIQGGMKLNKPDLTAADNVSTTIPRFNPFQGTSAAAPQAAGIAALLLSCHSAATHDQVREAIASSALPLEQGTFDAGVGIIMAHAAAEKFCGNKAAVSLSGAVNGTANAIAGVPSVQACPPGYVYYSGGCYPAPYTR